jgi:hypothetical protein
MPFYVGTMSDVDGEVGVTLEGPGIDFGGKRYQFINMQRGAAFIEAVNFAYEQGVRDGLRISANALPLEVDAPLYVSGSTPDSLHTRPERLGEKIMRGLRTLLRQALH